MRLYKIITKNLMIALGLIALMMSTAEELPLLAVLALGFVGILVIFFGANMEGDPE
tara:strand:+ start:396 stop:563 length:168 start_codon:yes stop_codon:yes gene_type:complete